MQVSHQVSMQFNYRDPAGLKILNPDCILGSIHLRIDPAGPQALHLPCGNIPFRGGASPAPASAKLHSILQISGIPFHACKAITSELIVFCLRRRRGHVLI